jgi:hypothetical protein
MLPARLAPCGKNTHRRHRHHHHHHRVITPFHPHPHRPVLTLSGPSDRLLVTRPLVLLFWPASYSVVVIGSGSPLALACIACCVFCFSSSISGEQSLQHQHSREPVQWGLHMAGDCPVWNRLWASSSSSSLLRSRPQPSHGLQGQLPS